MDQKGSAVTGFIHSSAQIAGHKGPVNIAVACGCLADIAPSIPSDTQDEAYGGWVFLGYVDANIHLDKAHILDRCDMTEGGLVYAVDQTKRAKAAFTTQDVHACASLVVDAAVSYGTTALRTFVKGDPRTGLRGLDALLALRDDCRHRIAIQICAFAQEGITNKLEALTLLIQAMEKGTDLVGCCLYINPVSGRPHRAYHRPRRALRLRRRFPHRLTTSMALSPAKICHKLRSQQRLSGWPTPAVQRLGDLRRMPGDLVQCRMKNWRA